MVRSFWSIWLFDGYTGFVFRLSFWLQGLCWKNLCAIFISILQLDNRRHSQMICSIKSRLSIQWWPAIFTNDNCVFLTKDKSFCASWRNAFLMNRISTKSYEEKVLHDMQRQKMKSKIVYFRLSYCKLNQSEK